MTRKEEINDFIASYLEQYNGDSYEAYAEKEDIARACLSAIEWANRTMLDRVCEWVEENHTLYEGVSDYFFAKDLRKAIEK